ncbi:MAG: TolB family protein [Eubacteriales bacterium]
MKRSVFLGICTAAALILISIVVWRLHGHVAPTSSPGQTSPSSPAVGVTPPSGGADSVVNDKMDTSGDDPPIIFTRDGNIYAVRLDGAAPAPLTNTGYDSRPYYLPQESKLLFIRVKSAHDITGDVMSIDFSTGRQTMLLPASVLGGLPDTGFVWAALSPGDGKLIVTAGNEAFGGFSLHLASPDGKDLSPPITGYVPAETCAFNPDGSGLAFENKHTDVRATLIYNLAWNKSPVPLITSADNDYNALWAEDYAWRPDGRSVTFFGYTFYNLAEGPKNGIYEVTTGGSVTPLYPTPGKWINGLHWLSADRLAFIAMPAGEHQGRDPGTAEFCVFDAPTGKLTLLMSLKYEKGQPQWSWNPNRTAFVFQKEWRGSLWVKDLSTGTEKEIVGTEGAEPLEFTWGSDPFSGSR